MINVSPADLDIVKKVMSNKTLFYASMPDPDRLLFDAGHWEPEVGAGWNYVQLKDGTELLGIIRYQPISIVAIDCHIHLLPKFWGKGISEEVASAFEDYILRNTNYHKLQVQCPISCRHSMTYVMRHGFEVEGILRGAAYWNSQVVHLVILGKLLRRTNHG